MAYRGAYRSIIALAALGVGLLVVPTAAAVAPGADGRFAYVGWTPVPGDPGSYSTAIFTANPDGSAQRIVPNTSALEGGLNPTNPVWSPDSQRLAYASETETTSTIVVIKPDGTGRLELAEGSDPAWTADGEWVSYTEAGVDLEQASTYKVPAAGGDPELVIDGWDVRWSPDGTKIAFHRGWWPDIFVRDLTTGDEINLTDNLGAMFNALGDWSPDSQKVVYYAEEGWPDPGSTLVANADGSNTVPLLTPATDLRWSPSGQRFVGVWAGDDGEALRIYRADGTVERTTAILGSDPAWGSAPLAPVGDQRPNTCAGATTTSAKAVWLKDTISSTTDQDWYRFSVTAKTRVQVILGALPENYRLDLYSTCSTLLSSSNRGGRQFEEIVRALPAGTYRVRVSGAPSSGTAYQLRFRQLAIGLPVLSIYSNFSDSGASDFRGEVLNNTSTNRTKIYVTLKFYNYKGGLVGSAKGSLGSYILKPGARLPFRFRVASPASAFRTSATVTSSTTTSASPVTLTVTSKPPWTRDGVCTPETCPDYFDEEGNVIEEDLTLHYDGTVRHGHSYTVYAPRVAATFYDSRGYVKDAYYLVGPSSLRPGVTSNWTVAQWETPNRATFIGVGLR